MHLQITPQAFVLPIVWIILPITISFIILLAKNRKNRTRPLQIIFFVLILTFFWPAYKFGNTFVSFFQLAYTGNIWLGLTSGSYLLAFLLILSKNNHFLKWSLYVYVVGYIAFWITLLNKTVIGLNVPIFMHVFLPMIAPLFYWPVFWTSQKLKTEGFKNYKVTNGEIVNSIKVVGLGFIIIIVAVILINLIAPQLLADYTKWYWAR